MWNNNQPRFRQASLYHSPKHQEWSVIHRILCFLSISQHRSTGSLISCEKQSTGISVTEKCLNLFEKLFLQMPNNVNIRHSLDAPCDKAFLSSPKHRHISRMSAQDNPVLFGKEQFVLWCFHTLTQDACITRPRFDTNQAKGNIGFHFDKTVWL